MGGAEEQGTEGGAEVTRADLFWRKVSTSDPAACWLWLSAVNRKGYGIISRRSFKESLAHRMAWRLTFGDIPAGACVLHRCDTPGCVNPSHLFIGSKADNNADMQAKGRYAIGETNGRSKLSDAQVEAIKNAAGRQREIAARFGIHQSQVSRIRAGNRKGAAA